MTNTLAAFLLASAATYTTPTEDDLVRYITERAATCWGSPAAMRGVSFSADFDVAFTREGHVSAIEVVAVAPPAQTFQAVADDLMAAFRRCGPYVTEGMHEMRLRMLWPM